MFFTRSMSPGCVLGSVTSSEWYKSRHVDKKAASNKDSLSTYPRGRLPIPGFAVMELQSRIWMLGLGCSADGMLFVWIMPAAI